MNDKSYLAVAFSSLSLLACQASDRHEKDHQHTGADHGHGHDHGKHEHHDAAKTGVESTAVTIKGTVEAGCAMCIYKMPEVNKCSLALKIAGKPYLVTGSTIFDHGDAHAEDGICKTRRDAVVEGRIEGAKFVATKLELTPMAE